VHPEVQSELAVLNVISSSQMALIQPRVGDLQMLFPRETHISREAYLPRLNTRG